MSDQREIELLRAQLETLETRNRELERAVGGNGRGRNRFASVAAAVLIVLSVILAPVAVVGSWVASQLADTDRFVETFAPLAADPALQQFAAEQTVQAIDSSMDIDSIVTEVFSGLGALGLPQSAQSALTLLEGPTAAGIRSMIAGSVETLIASPQFAQIWEATLRETHRHAIAIIQGDPNTALQLTDEGTISLNLSNIIRETKRLLVNQGFDFAQHIPEIDRMIPLYSSDSLLLIRAAYQLAVTLGLWLPWIVLALFTFGVVLARVRLRALMWGAAGLACSLLLLALGIGAGGQIFALSVSPSLMPAGAANALFAQLTLLLSSTLLALIALSIVIAVGAALAGGSRPAVAIRRSFDGIISAARAALTRHGLHTGKFGRAIDRWSRTITVLVIAVMIAALFLARPITLSGVTIAVLLALLVLLLVQLVRRSPRDEPHGPAASSVGAVGAEKSG